MKGICPNCEKETTLERIRDEEVIDVRGEKIAVDVEYFRCTECDAEFRDPRSDEDPLDDAYREYRRRHGMVQPEEIKAFRKRFALTQQQLADLLGWGAVTLSRYENGALQDEAHDTVLRLVMEPENLLELVELKPGALGRRRREQLARVLRQAVEGQDASFIALYENRFGQYTPDEFSGYRPLNVAKLMNAILYFCVDVSVPKTKLNKLLFYADFKHFHEYAVSITGARYAHLPYGPAPDNYQHYIAALHHEEEAVSIEERLFEGGFGGEFLTSLRKPDLSIFSTSELKVLATVKERFARESASSISALSHEEKAYQETVDGQLISYRYASELKA